MVEMPGTNGDPDLQIRLDLEQPERVGIRLEPGPDQQHRDLAARERVAAVPLTDAANDRRRNSLAGDGDVLDDPACELVVSRAHVVDVLTARRLSVRPLELLREPAKELDRLRQRVD